MPWKRTQVEGVVEVGVDDGVGGNLGEFVVDAVSVHSEGDNVEDDCEQTTRRQRRRNTPLR